MDSREAVNFIASVQSKRVQLWGSKNPVVGHSKNILLKFTCAFDEACFVFNCAS